jgi:hypothetical protein
MTKNNNPEDEIKMKERLRLCIVTNSCLFILIAITLLFFYDKESTYLRYGPHSDLNVLGIKINSWKHYIGLQFFLAIVEVTDVIINEMASPILGFNIYNPDKKEITQFTRFELQFYANSMWLLNGLKRVLMVVVSVSQIDIALLRVVYSEITSWYTIRILLLEKKFPKEDIKNDIDYQKISQDDQSTVAVEMV